MGVSSEWRVPGEFDLLWDLEDATARASLRDFDHDTQAS
jgi:hypothetical protein